MGAQVLGSGDGVRHYRARGSDMFFKAIAEEDDGDFSLMERTLPPGGRRPLAHRHTNCSEAYFVLDGALTVIVEGQELTLEPDDFLLVPRGTSHTFGNGGDIDVRLLVIHAPAMDAYFSGLHDLWNAEAPPTPDEERALMSRFGMETS
jgi:mannose-6-phosphate isomerase-like protein (cupin superfamily)